MLPSPGIWCSVLWKYENDFKVAAGSFFMQGDISKAFLSAFLPIHNKTSVHLLEYISLNLSLFA